MIRSLSLAAVLAAGLALPALAEDTATEAAPAATEATQAAPDLGEATSDQTAMPYAMVRKVGPKQCSPFMRGRRVVWKGPQPAQAE